MFCCALWSWTVLPDPELCMGGPYELVRTLSLASHFSSFHSRVSSSRDDQRTPSSSCSLLWPAQRLLPLHRGAAFWSTRCVFLVCNYLRHPKTAQVAIKFYLCVEVSRTSVSRKAVSCKFGIERQSSSGTVQGQVHVPQPGGALFVAYGEPEPLPLTPLSLLPGLLGLRRKSVLAPEVIRRSSSSKRQLLMFHYLVQASYVTQEQRPILKASPSTSAYYPRNSSLHLQLLQTEQSLNHSCYSFSF